jgi:hypothetical protein
MSDTNLPGGARARAKEIEARRCRAYEQGLVQGRTYGDLMLGNSKVEEAKAPPTPIQKLARDLGQDKLLLPQAVLIGRRFNDEGEEEATTISFQHLTFSIEDAVLHGVLTLAGHFSHRRAAALLRANPAPGWLHPMDPRSKLATFSPQFRG